MIIYLLLWSRLTEYNTYIKIIWSIYVRMYYVNLITYGYLQLQYIFHSAYLIVKGSWVKNKHAYAKHCIIIPYNMYIHSIHLLCSHCVGWSATQPPHHDSSNMIIINLSTSRNLGYKWPTEENYVGTSITVTVQS